MESNIVVAPNLNGKVYREFFPQQNIINTFIDFVDIYEDDLFFGTSNLTGRFWDGTICYYKDIKPESYDIEDLVIAEFLDVGVTDGKILSDSKKILISQDSGELKLFDANYENGVKLIKQNFDTGIEHDEFISEISLWSDFRNFVTGSGDRSIKIWNISENDSITCQHTYREAHFDVISSVDANKNSEHLFVSCSYDREALLWDKRTQDRGSSIYENEFCSLTQIKWHRTNENLVAIGNSAGDVYLVDIREPRDVLSKSSNFQRNIHKLCFNPSNDLLAVCADDTKVIVLDCADTNDLKIIYSSDAHQDFVRGFAWKDNLLVSCAWDKRILFHQL